jgi:hypothetical protein
VLDGSVYNVFEKCDEILTLNIDAVNFIIQKIISQKGYEGQLSSIIHLLKNNLMFLKSIIINAKANHTSLDEELKNELAKNRAFFLRINTVREQLKIWNLQKINQFLIDLANTEFLCRKNYAFSNIIMEGFLIQNCIPSQSSQ